MRFGLVGDMAPALPLVVGGGVCLAPVFLAVALYLGWRALRRGRNREEDEAE